jgi:hypothetical protein
MRGRHDRNFPYRLAVILAVGLAACASAAWSQDRGACVTANVPEAFTLPDGSEHPAGRLTLCSLEAFTPAVELHSVSVDGRGARLAMSRRAAPEDYAGTRPTFLFRRGPDGALDLVGYVVPFGDKSWSYTMRRSVGNGFGEPGSLATTRDAAPTIALEAAPAAPKG